MTIDTEDFDQLQQARMVAIQKLTELNSRHIRTQGQLAGIEIHLNRCREALGSERIHDDKVIEIERFEKEFKDVEAARAAIDHARDTLHQELQRLDDEVQACILKAPRYTTGASHD